MVTCQKNLIIYKKKKKKKILLLSPKPEIVVPGSGIFEISGNPSFVEAVL